MSLYHLFLGLIVVYNTVNSKSSILRHQVTLITLIVLNHYYAWPSFHQYWTLWSLQKFIIKYIYDLVFLAKVLLDSNGGRVEDIGISDRVAINVVSVKAYPGVSTNLVRVLFVLPCPVGYPDTHVGRIWLLSEI